MHVLILKLVIFKDYRLARSIDIIVCLSLKNLSINSFTKLFYFATYLSYTLGFFLNIFVQFFEFMSLH